MSDLFSRAYLLLTWTAQPGNGAAFRILRRQYAGGRVDYTKQLSRNLSGTLLTVEAPASKRRFMGRAVLDHDASGTVEYDAVAYTLGTHAHLKSAMEADDLQAKSFEDSSFWNAECVSPWDPKMEYGPMGNDRVQDLVLIEK